MTIVPDPQKKKGILDSLSIFERILILMICAVIGAIIIFGFSLTNIPQFILNVLIVGGLLVGLFFIVTGVMSYFEPKAYSPSGDFMQKVVNIAIKLKSPNVHDLWLRGEGWQGRSYVGQISGVGFIPYMTSKEIKDEDGKIIFMTDGKGGLLKDRNDKPIPKKEVITEKDGDILFVVKQGILGLGKPLLIRCHRSLCNSMMIGSVSIFSAGFSPYGNWLYPSVQWQSTIKQIMIQNEIETTQMTHASFLDLLSDVSRISVGLSPEFMRLVSLREERISTPPIGGNAPYQTR